MEQLAPADQGTATAWHAETPGSVVERLESAADGLTSAEASRRLSRYGPNRLPRTPPVPWWRILLRQLTSVVVGLLALATVVALVMGEVVEAVAIGVVLLLNTVLGFVVELRARRSMEALLRYEPLRTTVLRDGAAAQIGAPGLVPGDVLVLRAGDAVPADARLLDASDLRAVEGALTGESMPVQKSAGPVPRDTTLAERASMVYAGTSLATGSGHAIVVGTGADTELGRIGLMLGEIEDERTPLERRLDFLGRRLVWITLVVAAVVTALGWLRGESLALMVETGIALAIAAVPEGLPAVATIALAVGLRRMARRNAVVRRLHAVEALGSTTVVCTDKTGTLTAGVMSVTRLILDGREVAVSGAGYDAEGELSVEGVGVDPGADPTVLAALEVALLTARAEVVPKGDGWSVRGDPTDAGLLTLARKAGLETAPLLERWPMVDEVPFSTEHRLSASVHEIDGRSHALVKGAPQDVMDRCDSVLRPEGPAPLDDATRRSFADINDRLAADGLRLIGLARGDVEGSGQAALKGLTFVGLVALTDPPAAGVAETIGTLDGAGIRTIMITGDQAATATKIARELGLGRGDPVAIPGKELVGGDERLLDQLARATVFSRVSPGSKLDIVRVLQERGEIVAMLGDGVNDAAALKKADVGVAMGGRGTDVAREVSDIVLRDDRFATVGVAVEEGRVIYDNIRKFIFYLFSCNLAEVLVLFVAGLARLPLPILPLQILWLNLVTDTFPALALALEPGEPDVMRRPPRDPQATILSRRFVRSLAFYASLITLVTLAAFGWGLTEGRGYPHAVTLAFMTLAFAQLFHLGTARSTGPVLAPRRATANRYALGAVAIVVTLQVLAVTVEPLAAVLELTPLGAGDWIGVLGLAAVPAVVGQLLRLRH